MMLRDMTMSRKPKLPTKAPLRIAPPSSAFSHIDKVQYIAPPAIKNIKRLCGPRWIDALLHMPNRLLDRTQTTKINDAIVGERVTILATVKKRSSLSGMRFKRPFMVQLKDDSGTLDVIYFNYGGWIEHAYPLDEEVIVSGLISEKKDKIQIMHPDVWPAGKGVENIAKLWPLYPLTAGVSQTAMAR